MQRKGKTDAGTSAGRALDLQITSKQTSARIELLDGRIVARHPAAEGGVQ